MKTQQLALIKGRLLAALSLQMSFLAVISPSLLLIFDTVGCQFLAYKHKLINPLLHPHIHPDGRKKHINVSFSQSLSNQFLTSVLRQNNITWGRGGWQTDLPKHTCF